VDVIEDVVLLGFAMTWAAIILVEDVGRKDFFILAPIRIRFQLTSCSGVALTYRKREPPPFAPTPTSDFFLSSDQRVRVLSRFSPVL